MPSHEEIAEIKRSATPALLAIPGVVLVGLGSKEVGGSPTGQLVIKVYVREKKPPEDLPAEELIPADIEGVPTDVVLGGDIIPTVDPPGALIRSQDTDGTRYRPLTGGARIATEDSSFRGTLGCLMRHTTDATKVYVLTNQHVVAAPDVLPITAGITRVGQPSGIDSCTDCCDDLIGTYVGGGKSGERDEALVQLSAGTQWLAEIVEIGVVRDEHTVTTQEEASGTYKVRKRGARTRLTGGVISSIDGTATTADNLIVITPNPHPDAGPGDTVFFQYEGDSGAALVNDNNEVVGLMFGRDNVGLGYGYSIAGVRSRLASIATVAVATATTPGVVNTVPGAAMAVLPPELVPALVPDPVREPPGALVRPRGRVRTPVGGWLAGPQPDLAGGVANVQRDLDRSRAGRLLLGLWLEHQDELLHLVNNNRRVTLAWHREGGAALFQLLIRMLGRPELALPRTLHGRPLARCVDALRDVLTRFASSGLRTDLDRVRADLPDLAGLTYPQIITALDSA